MNLQIIGIYELNKNVLSLDLNEENEIVCLSSIGSLFQTSGAAALNDRLAVSVLSLFTVNSIESDDLRLRRGT